MDGIEDLLAIGSTPPTAKSSGGQRPLSPSLSINAQHPLKNQEIRLFFSPSAPEQHLSTASMLPLPDDVSCALFPYQQAGVQWMFDRHKNGTGARESSEPNGKRAVGAFLCAPHRAQGGEDAPSAPKRLPRLAAEKEAQR